MNKNDVILKLRDAARTHKQWVSDALALIQGVPLDKEKVPVNATECAFGKWYYGEGQGLRELQGFKEIEGSHDKLHKIYMEIFAIIFGEVQGTSFFNRLFGLSHKIAAENREAAMEKFHLLEQQSDVILKQFSVLGETNFRSWRKAIGEIWIKARLRAYLVFISASQRFKVGRQVISRLSSNTHLL